MARFQFSIEDGDLVEAFEVEIPTPDRARAEAAVTAGEMLRDLGRGEPRSKAWRMKVRDESGDHIFSVEVAPI